MSSPPSYLICGTPRTGSTLLGSLLASTGVAGRPESYFREPDKARWARELGVPIHPDGSFDYRRFVDAAVRAGSTPNGVFGARIMWGTMEVLTRGLSAAHHEPDLAVLQRSFGPVRLVHLRRLDVVEQAVSWARAEQSGYWQRGDVRSGEPQFDPGLLHSLMGTIEAHEAAWRSWFDRQGAHPLEVTYEGLIDDRRGTVERILDHLGVDPPAGWAPGWPVSRQADELNADWTRRIRGSQ
jgi:trehalose 2-sulfotransferase